jgi:hypothetical protein
MVALSELRYGVWRIRDVYMVIDNRAILKIPRVRTEL